MAERTKTIRWLMVLALLGSAAGASWFLFGTERGHWLMHHAAAARGQVDAWAARHWVVAPALLIGVYVALCVLLLPVWWVQMLAGLVFGLASGVLWCVVAGAVAALTAAALSRWLIGDWFQHRLEARATRLRRLDEKLGHNGFLVVMAVRLVHVFPFGISNWLFGMLRISFLDVAMGTVLGNIPAVTLYVGLGADPRRAYTAQFVGLILVLELILIAPLILRYLRPHWFQRIGIE